MFHLKWQNLSLVLPATNLVKYMKMHKTKVWIISTIWNYYLIRHDEIPGTWITQTSYWTVGLPSSDHLAGKCQELLQYCLRGSKLNSWKWLMTFFKAFFSKDGNNQSRHHTDFSCCSWESQHFQWKSCYPLSKFSPSCISENMDLYTLKTECKAAWLFSVFSPVVEIRGHTWF